MTVKNKVQLITYPNSLGGNLKALDEILKRHFKGVFAGVHILPPFESSGDRGFAPKTYFKIEPSFGEWEDIKSIGSNFDIVVDMMVNHISKESDYFEDFLKNGFNSPYADYFITMDKLWKDKKPVQADIDKMFLRRKVPYSQYTVCDKQELVWTTFGAAEKSQQIDLDVHSDSVNKMFLEVFDKFYENNIKMVRLDAVGFVIKKIGTDCFFVKPDIYEFLDKLRAAADERNIELLPEIHAKREIQDSLSERNFWTYDFILPYRMLEMLLCRTSGAMQEYLGNRSQKQFTTLDCHDGVPIKPDLDGFYNPDLAKKVVQICEENGCHCSRIFSDAYKDADGFDVHQICGTYFSMLGYNEKAYIAARAVQLFVPGIPQVYYVGVLAGENHLERFEQTGDYREINRYNFTASEVEQRLASPTVKRICEIIRFRNNCQCFNGNFLCSKTNDNFLKLTWRLDNESCTLTLGLADYSMEIIHTANCNTTKI